MLRKITLGAVAVAVLAGGLPIEKATAEENDLRTGSRL